MNKGIVITRASSVDLLETTLRTTSTHERVWVYLLDDAVELAQSSLWKKHSAVQCFACAHAMQERSLPMHESPINLIYSGLTTLADIFVHCQSLHFLDSRETLTTFPPILGSTFHLGLCSSSTHSFSETLRVGNGISLTPNLKVSLILFAECTPPHFSHQDLLTLKNITENGVPVLYISTSKHSPLPIPHTTLSPEQFTKECTYFSHVLCI